MAESENCIWDEFTNQYSLSKTLRFELKPVGKTEELVRNIKEKKDFDLSLADLILEDKERAEAYKKVKRLIDDLHREFLCFALSDENISPFQKDNLNKEIGLFYNEYTKSKKDWDDVVINRIQKELASKLVDILDNSTSEFFETLKEKREYLKQQRADDEQKLKRKKEKRESIAKQIKEASKSETEKLEELRTERRKLDKQIQDLERTLKEYKKCLGYEFRETSHLYKKTDTLFTLLRLFYIQDEKATKSIKEFDGFNSYFGGFNKNRENVYDIKGEGNNDNWHFKSTSVAHRLFEQNIKFHFDNIKKWENLRETIKKYQDTLEEKDWSWDKELQKVESKLNFNAEEIFKYECFLSFLSQKGIDMYNKILGGIPEEEGKSKVQGINELVNLTRQKAGAGRKEFPPLQEFYKQILSEQDGEFIEAFESNEGLIEKIDEFVEDETKLINFIEKGNKESGELSFSDLLEELEESRKEENRNEIYISKESLRFISNDLTGSWNALEQWYLDGFEDTEKKKQAKRKAFTIKEIEDKLQEKREWVDTNESNKEKSNFYEQFIETADKTNRPWLKDGKMESENIFLSYFKSKYYYLLNQRKETLCNYKKCTGSLKDKENLNDEVLDKKEKKPIKEYLDASRDLFSFFRSLSVKEKDLDKSEEQNDSWKKFIQSFLDENRISRLYNMARNFLTKKDFSTKKFKLNFENSTLAAGWDLNKETDNTAVLLVKDEQFYLAIMNKENNRLFEFADDDKHKKEIESLRGKISEQENKINKKSQGTRVYEEELKKLGELRKKLENLLLIKGEGSIYKKMNYKFFKDGTTMIPKCSTQLNEVKKHFTNSDNDFNTSIFKQSKDKKKQENFKKDLIITKEIFELNNFVYDKNTNSFVSKRSNDTRPKKFQKKYLELSKDEKGYRDALTKWINFCRNFCECYTSVAEANYDYKDTFTRNYDSLDKFYNQLSGCIYKITFSNISENYINKMIDDEKIYLFQIYNKDFSPHSKGRKNLHTLYWKSLFDENNLKDVVSKLNGEAEIFYRKTSIKYSQSKREKGHHSDIIKGEIKQRIEKGERNPILKDKRYSEDKLLFHCPITLNFKAIGTDYINKEINQHIKDNLEKVNIIGIDRGERNLLYYTVIDQQGDILGQGSEQGSFNEIDNDFKPKGESKTRKINYWDKLNDKEKERAGARENWETIENIKELKEGYLSQVVHQLSKLIIKHNAIVVLEDLNFGFKRGRFKVEKQVYQKFEKALIDKLNYSVFKDNNEFGKAGHHLRAYQLTNKFDSFQKLGKQSGILFYTTAGYTSKTDPVTGYMRSLYHKYKDAKNSQGFFGKFDSIIYNGEHFEFTYELKNLKGMTGSYEDKNENDETKLTRTKWTIHSHIDRSEFKERKLTADKKDLPEYESAKNGKWKSHEVISVNQKLKDLFEKEGLVLEAEKDYKEGICDSDNTEKFHKSKFLAKLTAHFNRLLDMRVTDSSKMNEGVHNHKSDFILSPVEPFYDSRNCEDDSKLPQDSDANGAYNVARKGVIILNRIDSNPEDKIKGISKTDWQNYAQRDDVVNRQRSKYNS